MEDALYNTSWVVHKIPKPTSSLSRLLSAPTADPQARDEHRDHLSTHAESLQTCLGKDQPRYEREEEKEQLGGLKNCTWTRLENALNDGHQLNVHTGEKRKRDRQDDEKLQSNGLLISLVYEKKTYKFIIYTTSSSSSASKRTRTAGARYKPSTNSTNEATILLSKSSPAALKSLTNYLSDTFSLSDIYPLKLSSAFIQSTLEEYLTTTYTSLLSNIDSSVGTHLHLQEQVFKSLIGTIKLAIAFSAPVAPSLKTLEVAVPSPTVLDMCKRNQLERTKSGKSKSGSRPADSFFMGWLAGFIMAKSGLSITVLRDIKKSLLAQHHQEERLTDNDDAENNTRVEEENLPMKVSRISTGSYAISVDSRLKFVFKAVDAVDGEGEENSVRQANRDLLVAVVEEARKQVSEEG